MSAITKSGKPKKLRMMRSDTDRWEKLAGEVARCYAPEVVPCEHCGYPKITGYICDRCEDQNS